MSVRRSGGMGSHDLLGSHVQGRAGDRAFLREMDDSSSLTGLHQAEVEQLGDVIAGRRDRRRTGWPA